MLDPPNSVQAAECSDLSPWWFQHQLHSSTHRLPILSNVCICKYKHNDKLTSQPHTDTCTSCSRQATSFRHVNKLTYFTFCNSSQHFIIQIGAFWQVQQHYGSHERSMKKHGQCLGRQIATPSETQRCSDPIPSSNPLSVISSQQDNSSSWSLQHISNMTCQQSQNDSLITAVLLVYWYDLYCY
jgi:hypothetical protein